MKTTELNGKRYTLREGEDGQIILDPIKEETPPRKNQFKYGDVWRFENSLYIALGNGQTAAIYGKSGVVQRNKNPDWFASEYIGNVFEDLGSKANDSEYIKRSDVIDALSIRDSEGDSFLKGVFCNSPFPYREVTAETRAKLKALGIQL